ncbi:MAG: serine hydrolase domain-containing protein, partial [Bacteroidota bacterium]
YIGKFGLNLEKELEIEFDPGTYYSYSGEGIYLLHFVVEQLTGRKLEDLAQEYVFQPLGMHMTSFVWQDRFEENRAMGHYKKKKIVPTKRRMTSNAAGSMETTPEDFTKFMQAMLRREGLSPAAFEEMISPQIKITSRQQFGPNRLIETDENRDIDLSYGLGWGIYETPHGKAVFKEGHIQGWEHYCIFYPDHNLGMVIMTNSSNGEGIFRDVLKVTMADTWMPWYWEGYMPYKR